MNVLKVLIFLYIYRKNNKINILLNTNETTKQYILNDEVEELLLDILNKNFD